MTKLLQIGPLRALVKRMRTSLWKQAQWPDPEQLYRERGLFQVTAYLRQCWSPDITRDILARFGAQIHRDAWPVGPNITVHEPGESYGNLHVGAFSHLGKEVFLDLTDRIVIEDSVSVGMRTIILTHLDVGQYPGKPIAKLVPKKKRPTILRRGCSVGAGAVLLCGVEIGEDAVVGAGVVVDHDVPSGTIVTSSHTKPDYTIPERLLRKARESLELET